MLSCPELCWLMSNYVDNLFMDLRKIRLPLPDFFYTSVAPVQVQISNCVGGGYGITQKKELTLRMPIALNNEMKYIIYKVRNKVVGLKLPQHVLNRSIELLMFLKDVESLAVIDSLPGNRFLNNEFLKKVKMWGQIH